MSSANVTASATAEYVNPVLGATRQVFEMLLGCTPRRTGLTLRNESTPRYAISAVIGFTGKSVGTLVVRFSKEAALELLKRMLGDEETELTPAVADAVGEVANMIAGGAKASLEKQNLSISLPNIVMGLDHIVVFPSHVTPVCILLDSEIGPFLIEIAFSHVG